MTQQSLEELSPRSQALFMVAFGSVMLMAAYSFMHARFQEVGHWAGFDFVFGGLYGAFGYLVLFGGLWRLVKHGGRSEAKVL